MWYWRGYKKILNFTSRFLQMPCLFFSYHCLIFVFQICFKSENNQNWRCRFLCVIKFTYMTFVFQWLTCIVLHKEKCDLIRKIHYSGVGVSESFRLPTHSFWEYFLAFLTLFSWCVLYLSVCLVSSIDSLGRGGQEDIGTLSG